MPLGALVSLLRYAAVPCAPLILRVQENQRWSIVSEDVSDDIDPELAAHQAQQFNRMFVAAGTGETTNELNSQLDVNTVRWFGRFILPGYRLESLLRSRWHV